MQRYRVRDRSTLRERMARSQRVVPHSVRSLAALVGVSHGTVGHLLTGEQASVTEDLARRLAAALGVHLEDLFERDASTSIDMDASKEVGSICPPASR